MDNDSLSSLSFSSDGGHPIAMPATQRRPQTPFQSMPQASGSGHHHSDVSSSSHSSRSSHDDDDDDDDDARSLNHPNDSNTPAHWPQWPLSDPLPSTTATSSQWSKPPITAESWWRTFTSQPTPAGTNPWPGPGTQTGTTPTKPRWLQQGGFYRDVDLTQPWLPSPRIDAVSTKPVDPDLPLTKNENKAAKKKKPTLAGAKGVEGGGGATGSGSRSSSGTSSSSRPSFSPYLALPIPALVSPTKAPAGQAQGTTFRVDLGWGFESFGGGRENIPFANAGVGNVRSRVSSKGKGKENDVGHQVQGFSSGQVPVLRISTVQAGVARDDPPDIDASAKTTVRRTSTIKKWKKKVSRWLDKPSIKSAPETPNPQPLSPSAIHETDPDEPHLSEWVSPSEWKEWGYYARPIVNGVQVYNTPSPFTSSTELAVNYTIKHISDEPHIPIDQIFASLKDANGHPRPDNWRLGITHPSLPPRPNRWPTKPDPLSPLPFPWEVQLNPLLEHILVGVPRLYWNIAQDLSGASHSPSSSNSFFTPLTPGDLSQPASHPFLTHMWINALADDTAPVFPWPCMVSNPHGIKLRDVLTTIHSNFQQYVFRAEYESWMAVRREEAAKARARRCDTESEENRWRAVYGEVRREDEMRRVDYLVGRTLFRGLAPNPDLTGWVLFLGQA